MQRQKFVVVDQNVPITNKVEMNDFHSCEFEKAYTSFYPEKEGGLGDRLQ